MSELLVLREAPPGREGEDICPPIDRLGPYDSREEAERALEKAEQRNEEWDNDPKWNDEAED